MKSTLSFFTRSIAATTALGLLAAFTGCSPKTGQTSNTDTTNVTANNSANGGGVSVERGKYLVTVAACNDCHTPFKMGKMGPEPDMSRMLSGHPANLKLPAAPKLGQEWGLLGSATNTAFVGGWGTSYAANLTPDSATGIGKWTQDQFVSAIRSGQFVGAKRPIMPPMPWFWVSKMTDDDLKSVFAYLKSIPAVANAVPAYVPPAGGPPGAAPAEAPGAAPAPAKH